MEISIQSLYKEISVLGLRDGWLDVALEKFGSSIDLQTFQDKAQIHILK